MSVPPIVVAVGPGPAAAEPLALARELARDSGARIHAVAAYDVHAMPAGPSADPSREAACASLEAALACLDGCEATAHAQPCRTVAAAVQARAALVGAGLIVAGSSPRGAPGRVRLGATAEGLLRGARCAVAFAPRGYAGGKPIERVGLALPDTREGREALRAATALAHRYEAPIDAFSFAAPVVGRHAAGGARVATAAVTATEHSGVALTPHAVPPDGVLDALTADLDLLVCGARGYGRLREMLAHGVARRLIGAAACPVVVVPRGTAAAFATLVTGAGRVGSVA